MSLASGRPDGPQGKDHIIVLKQYMEHVSLVFSGALVHLHHSDNTNSPTCGFHLTLCSDLRCGINNGSAKSECLPQDNLLKPKARNM